MRKDRKSVISYTVKLRESRSCPDKTEFVDIVIRVKVELCF